MVPNSQYIMDEMNTVAPEADVVEEVAEVAAPVEATEVASEEAAA